MVIRDTMLNDAAGMLWKGPMCLSIFKVWVIGKVPCWIIGIMLRIPDAQIGIIFIRHLTSSTC